MCLSWRERERDREIEKIERRVLREEWHRVHRNASLTRYHENQTRNVSRTTLHTIRFIASYGYWLTNFSHTSRTAIRIKGRPWRHADCRIFHVSLLLVQFIYCSCRINRQQFVRVNIMANNSPIFAVRLVKKNIADDINSWRDLLYICLIYFYIFIFNTHVLSTIFSSLFFIWILFSVSAIILK